MKECWVFITQSPLKIESNVCEESNLSVADSDGDGGFKFNYFSSTNFGLKSIFYGYYSL